MSWDTNNDWESLEHYGEDRREDYNEEKRVESEKEMREFIENKQSDYSSFVQGLKIRDLDLESKSLVIENQLLGLEQGRVRLQLEKLNCLRSLICSVNVTENPSPLKENPTFERIFSDTDEMIIKGKMIDIVRTL